jgi:hypothetical protein
MIQLYGLSFIVTLITAALSHRKPAYARISHDGYSAQDNDKRNDVYNSFS